MKFIEVECLFTKPLPIDERKSYESLYGDDREDWPKDQEWFMKDVVSINIDNINSFNPSTKKNQTTLRMQNDNEAFIVAMAYTDFKKLINALSK